MTPSRNTTWKIRISILLVCGLLCWGCQQVEQHPSGPAASGDAWSLGNYWGMRGEFETFRIYVAPQARDEFSVNVPAPAPQCVQGYELAYQVMKAGESEATEFLVNFKVTDAAVLCLGLPAGDVLQQAELYQADFAEQTPLLIDGPLRLFGFPGGWSGWDGPEPPLRIPPLSLSASAMPLYAFPATLVPEMDNFCEVLPTPTPAPAAVPAVPPFLEVVVSVAYHPPAENGTEDIASFAVQEPGGAPADEMWYDPADPTANANGLVIFEDAPSLSVDDSWTSGADQFRIFSPAGSPLASPLGYQAIVSNQWGGVCPQDPLPVTIIVTTHTTTQTFTCDVDCNAPNDDAQIQAIFPAGTISAVECD